MFSRRWVLFALAVGLGVWGMTWLGSWQFDRLDERRDQNELLKRNLHAAPVPFDEVMSVGKPVAEQDEWRRVTVTGAWDDTHTIVLKYQTRKGGAGIDVVTPLVTTSGAAVIVDRGWMPTDNTGGERPDTPPTVTGTVTVTGWVRRDSTGDEAAVSDMSARSLSSREVAKVVDYPVYGGFVDLDEQSPPPADDLAGHELPDEDSEGPHFFYGLQWWFFGALAVFGFFYLMWDEKRTSQRAQHATVDGQHDAGDER